MFKSLLNLFKRDKHQAQAENSPPVICTPPIIQSQCCIPPIKKKLSIKSHSNPKEYYKVNLIDLSCTCLDWQDSRKNFPPNSLNRCCKHIVEALSNESENRFSKLIYFLIQDTSTLGKGLSPYSDYKLKNVASHEVLYIFNSNEWVNLYIHTGNSIQKYGYNKLQDRWAYGKIPKTPDLFLNETI